MTGSAIIIGDFILPGQPVAEDASGNLSLAFDGNHAFAVAIDGAPAGGVLTYATEGTVERQDWFLITGSKLLISKRSYYLSGVGKLSLNGTQQIGVARSPTVLRIQVLEPTSKVSRIFPVTGSPYADLGSEGDLAYDSTMKQLWGPKTNYGWGRPAWLIKDVLNWHGSVNVVNLGDNIWHPTAT